MKTKTIMLKNNLFIVVTLQASEEALCTEGDTSSKLKLYETLGDAAVAVQCFEKAIKYYRKMLVCAEEIKSDRRGAALLSLAQTLKDVKQYNEALDFAHRELELCTDPREICRSALFLADLLIVVKANDEKIQEIYNLALKNAKICNDISLEVSVLKEHLNYLNNSSKTEEIEALKIKLDMLEKLNNNVDSESESEENHIGEDICLENLSDIEAELRVKENIKNKKRTRKKSIAIKRNEKGETQLHVACINGNIEIVEKLLESGHLTNVRDHFGWTPLHEAANHGHVEIAKLLLKYGADVNDPGSLMCQGVTPLHDAASCGNFTMMKLLIEHGANVILKTNEDDTVLDCLEQWKDRVDFLSPEDQRDYDEIHKILSAMIPISVKKISKRIHESACNSKTHIINKAVIIEKISAGEDYKRTIASLKHRIDPIGTSLSSVKKNMNPLLNSEEVLLDNWLEDDMNENVSNRRYSDENFSSIMKRKSSNEDINDEKNLKRSKINDLIVKDNECNMIQEDSNDYDIETIQNFSESKIQKKNQQISLLSIGFTKNSISHSSSSVIPTNTGFELGEIDTMKSVILNISVDGKVFKIQVEFSNTMRPLIEKIVTDIENKFYNDNGCRVKLELKTMNGIMINCNNVFTILNEGDVVKNLICEIIHLEIPSIIERYKTICKNFNIGKQPLNNILKIFILIIFNIFRYSRMYIKMFEIMRKHIHFTLKTRKY